MWKAVSRVKISVDLTISSSSEDEPDETSAVDLQCARRQNCGLEAASAKLSATEEGYAHVNAADSQVLAGGAHGVSPYSNEEVAEGGKEDRVQAAEDAEESKQAERSNRVGYSSQRSREVWGNNQSEIKAEGRAQFGCQQCGGVHEFQKGDTVLARFKNMAWDDAEIEEVLPPDPKGRGKCRYRVQWEDGTMADTIKTNKHLKRKM